MASPGSLKACPRKVQERADGPATVLAIGTANPPNVFLQRDYPEFYFSITNSNHMTELKQKFQRMCDRSRINKRYMHLNEEILKANPSMCAYWEKSLDARQDIVMVEVPKLGKEAAAKAIQEWGQPKSKITHLIFCTTSGVDMPGADWALLKLLQLRPNVQRLMLYQQGCFAGGTAIRIAKDLAENNKGARVLVVCTEINAIFFRGPSEAHPESLVGPALFGDGAAAMILGCDAIPHIERGWFEVQYAGSSIVPNSEGALEGNLREVGLTFHLVKDLPGMIADNIGCELEEVMEAAFGEEGAPSLNDMFWIVHPGGPAILDRVEQQLRLQPEKLAPSRHVLSEFGNMSSPGVIFIMDHLRKLSLQQNAVTSGAGSEWGFLLAFGPGLTCETVLLRSLPLLM